jgi:alanine-glyoxylate transaminase/serine-glyoxylate transaminase/serine-pyruvate transaminase
LRRGLEAIGVRFFVEEQWRLPQLNSIVVPEGVDEANLRRVLLKEFDLEIGAGLGALAGKVWRVGLMGQSACRRNVLFFLSAMEAVLGRSGAVAAAR